MIVVGSCFAGNKKDHTVTCDFLTKGVDPEVVVDRLLNRLGVRGNEGLWAIYPQDVPLHKANEDFYRYMDAVIADSIQDSVVN